MTKQELTKLYDRLEQRLINLETAILNHTGVHKTDRIVQTTTLILMAIVILMLKFKIL